MRVRTTTEEQVSTNRSIWEFVHHWLGRSVLAMGIANCIIGFGLLSDSGSLGAYPRVFIAVTGVITLAWLGMVMYHLLNRSRVKQKDVNSEAFFNTEKSDFASVSEGQVRGEKSVN